MRDRFFTNGYMPKERLVNAGENLLSCIKGHRVIALEILLSHDSDEKKDIHLILKKGFTKHQFRHVLNVLNHCWFFGGFGRQYLYGIILCDNGVWFERFEYDGAESWVERSLPSIPQELCWWSASIESYTFLNSMANNMNWPFFYLKIMFICCWLNQTADI